MNLLPRLLRRLEQAAKAGDEKDLADIFEQLDRNEGWSDSVDEFIETLDAKAYSVVEQFRDLAGDPMQGVGGGNSQSSGLPYSYMSQVTRDAAAGVYTPASLAEWNNALLAAKIPNGSPSRLWLLQEAAGNPADSIGSSTLTASSVAGYQQAVTGWARKAITFTDTGGAEEVFNNSDASLPDVSVKSVLLLSYIAITATPAAERGVIVCGNGNGIKANVTAADKAAVYINATNEVTGASSLGTTVRPWVAQINATNSSALLATDQDKLIPTWSAPASAKGVFIGGAVQTSPAAQVLYAAQFEGVAAELTSAQIKNLLMVLGWSPAWS